MSVLGILKYMFQQNAAMRDGFIRAFILFRSSKTRCDGKAITVQLATMIGYDAAARKISA